MKPVYLIGDVHGKFQELYRFLNHVQESIIICVGDFGVGFAKNVETEFRILDNLNKELALGGNELWTIKGNHDAPHFFTGDKNWDFSCLKFIPDYHQMNLLGYKTLFVGGGISIDRKWRKEGISYWKDEAIQPIPNDIKNQNFDLVITHDCPNFVNHSSNTLYDEPGNPVKTDAYNGRVILDELFEVAKPKRWFYGHYHNSDSTQIGETRFRCLNELEVVELK